MRFPSPHILRRSRRLAMPLVLVVALAGCSKTAEPTDKPAPGAAATAPGSGEPGQPAAPAAGEMPMPSAAIAGGGGGVKPVPSQLPAVVARINGEDVTKAEFETTVKNIEQRAGQPVPPAQRDGVYRRLLEDLIRYRLILQESKNRKTAVTDADVDARVGAVRAQFPDENAFNEMMKTQGLTTARIRAELRNELLVERLLRAEIEQKVTVTSDDVNAFFKENPQEFQMPERVHASHILITVPEGASAEVKKTALAKANTVLASAKAGGDFAALAKEHSQDPGSAPRGGDLDFFQKSDMVGPFGDAAFKLAPGALSDVVETQFGYHIIKVHKKEPGRTVTLNEARPRIEERLRATARQKLMQDYVEGLRAKAKIDVLI